MVVVLWVFLFFFYIRTGHGRRKDEQIKTQTNSQWKPGTKHSGHQVGLEVHLPMGPKQVETMQEWILSGPARVKIWETLERPEHVCPLASPSNLAELERTCREKWQKIPRYSKLAKPNPKSLEALITARTELQSEYLYNVVVSAWFYRGFGHFLAGQASRLRPQLAVDCSLVSMSSLKSFFFPRSPPPEEIYK